MARLLILPLLVACTTQANRKAKSAQQPTKVSVAQDVVQPSEPQRPVVAPIQLEPIGLRVAEDGKADAFEPWTLLSEGNKLFGKQEFNAARGKYQKLVATFPTSLYVSKAHFNIGLSYEREGNMVLAGNAYLDAYRKGQSGVDGRDALLRRAAVLAEADLFADAEEALKQLEGRQDLGRHHELEVLARRGYVELSQDKLDAAERSLSAALDIYRRMTSMEEPYFIAMAHYYYANVPHQRALAHPMTPETLGESIKRKVALADQAYVRYQKALVFLSSYWATASAYQMSQLYHDIWRQANEAPVMEGMEREAVERFRQQTRQSTRYLLEKALHGHRENVHLADAFGVTTPWSEGSKKRVQEIAPLLITPAP